MTVSDMIMAREISANTLLDEAEDSARVRDQFVKCVNAMFACTRPYDKVRAGFKRYTVFVKVPHKAPAAFELDTLPRDFFKDVDPEDVMMILHRLVYFLEYCLKN